MALPAGVKLDQSFGEYRDEASSLRFIEHPVPGGKAVAERPDCDAPKRVNKMTQFITRCSGGGHSGGGALPSENGRSGAR